MERRHSSRLDWAWMRVSVIPSSQTTFGSWPRRVLLSVADRNRAPMTWQRRFGCMRVLQSTNRESGGLTFRVSLSRCAV